MLAGVRGPGRLHHFGCDSGPSLFSWPERAWGPARQAPLAGEIIAYLADEGDPVEYRQELVEIAPYFGA